MNGKPFLAVALLVFAVPAAAGVTAAVDRNVVEQNESFLLEVVVEGNLTSEPDVSALEEDFVVGQSSQMSNTRIVNGQISRSMTWAYTLMARRPGELEIPAVRVGNESSEPLTITVREPVDAPPGEADVFVTAELDSDETWVHAQVLYKIKIYRAVAWRQPTLREPELEGAEALVEFPAEETTYDAILGGKAYDVIEKTIAIFPQESGEIRISPTRFEARIIANGRITGRKVFESEAHTITVRPIPAPPADHPDAAWLPARDLKVEESWSREPRRLLAGEPISRTVSVSVLGQLETQIPALDIAEPDGINLYPDQPELARNFETGGIRGRRTDNYAMIAVGDGEVTLPRLDVPWFNTATESWEVASLPERTLTILPVPGSAETVAAAPAAIETRPPADRADVAIVSSPFWQQVSAGLFVLWIMTLGVWWWSLRPKPRVADAPAPEPVHKRQARSLKAARKAALADDAPGLRAALLEWGRLEWPNAAPRSIGELTRRLEPPLADQLRALSRSSYGPDAPHWDGEAIARSLRSFAIRKSAAPTDNREVLPPLMPSR